MGSNAPKGWETPVLHACPPDIMLQGRCWRGGWCKATCHTAETPEAQAHLHRWENYSYGAWVV